MHGLILIALACGAVAAVALAAASPSKGQLPSEGRLVSLAVPRGRVPVRHVKFGSAMRRARAAVKGKFHSTPVLVLPGTAAAKLAIESGHLRQMAAPASVLRTPSSVSAGNPLATALTAPATGLGLDGLREASSQVPDVQFAAGPGALVEVVNLELAIWTKGGRASASSVPLATFFNIPGDRIGDPRVLYDTASNRWFASILDVSTDTFALAVSTSSDPTGRWSLYKFSFPGCPDQPRLGIDDNQVLISANLYDSCSESNFTFIGARVAAVSKSDVLSGAPARNQLFGTSDLFSIAPAQTLGSDAVGWMASVDANDSGVVHVFEVTGTPPDATIAQSDLPISPHILTPPPAPEPAGLTIDTGDNRLQDAAWQAGILYLAFNDGCSIGEVVHSCAGAMAISTSGPSLLWRHDVAPSGEDAYYPALRPDPDGNVLMGFGVSSASVDPGGDVAAFIADGTLVSALASIKPGAGPVVQPAPSTDGATAGRYGDYFSAAVDPSHPHTIWAAVEVGTDSSGRWGTAIRAAAIAPEQARVGSPVVFTAPVGRTHATLSVSIDPAGTDTSYALQYGTTSAYGAQTGSAPLAGGTSAESAVATLDNLIPGTTYHVRAVATNPGGTVFGPDATFTMPFQCLVPMVKGRSLPAARTAISASRCSTGKVTRVRSRTVKSGRVISQNPSPGALLPVGSKVNLVVSRGKRGS